MLIVVLVGVVLAVVGLGRVGPRSTTQEFPFTWPSTAALSTPGTRRHPAMVVVPAAVLVGVGLGIAARLWMRLIAPDPEFTMAGTIGIMVGFGLLFLGAGLSLTARQHGWRRTQRGIARGIGCLLILPAFGGAGGLAFPSVVLGAIAVARWDLRLPLRWFLGLASVGITVVVAATQIPDPGLTTTRTVMGIALYPVVLWPMLLAARLSIIRTSPLAPTRTNDAESAIDVE